MKIHESLLRRQSAKKIVATLLDDYRLDEQVIRQAMTSWPQWLPETRSHPDLARRHAPKQMPAKTPKYSRPARGGLTQAETAKVLGMTERGVREVERRALEKLRNHPALRELWRDYTSAPVNETDCGLTSEEIRALFDLAINQEESNAITKIVAIISGEESILATTGTPYYRKHL